MGAREHRRYQLWKTRGVRDGLWREFGATEADDVDKLAIEWIAKLANEYELADPDGDVVCRFVFFMAQDPLKRLHAFARLLRAALNGRELDEDTISDFVHELAWGMTRRVRKSARACGLGRRFDLLTIFYLISHVINRSTSCATHLESGGDDAYDLAETHPEE
jgi:hypothetical protein